MKRKISLVLVALVLVIGIVGCSSKEKTYSKEDRTEIATCTQKIIELFSYWGPEDYAQIKDTPDFELNITLRSYLAIPATAETFWTMIDTWESAEEECGAFKAPEQYEFKYTENNNGIAVSFEGDFEKREATITMQFDEKLNISTLDVSGHYSLGEILKKAGLNTVLGMGVVFAVLIFLAFIIGLFQYIPKILDAMKKKPVAQNNETVVEESSVQTVIEEIDDLELIAVITAAIAAQEGTSSDSFVVRSIKRRTSNRW